jgi:hypothetical protein
LSNIERRRAWRKRECDNPTRILTVGASVIQLFQPQQDHMPVVRRVLLSAVICYAVSGIAAWLLLPAIVGNIQNPFRAVGLSVLYVASITGLASVAAEVQLRRLRRRLPVPKRAVSFALLNVALWITPVVAICQPGGLQAILVSAAFSFAGAMLLGWLVSLLQHEDEPVCLYNPSAFPVSVGVAYVGIAVAVSGYDVIGQLIIAMSCFSMGWMVQRYKQHKQQQVVIVVSRFWKQLFWAVFMTFIALLPNFRRFGPPPFYEQLPSDKRGKTPKFGEMQAGVILLAKPKAPVLLEPPRKAKFQTRTKQQSFRLVSIPFSGQYWFFRRPRLRPPLGSLIEPGDPTTLTMTLEDGVFVMQAQQLIGQALNVDCCRFIDLVLNGKEEEPETVLPELILVNSSAPGNNMQTLGSQAMASKISTLRFAIPLNSAVSSFDELLVWFHLKAPRNRRSATVSIERFDLIP